MEPQAPVPVLLIIYLLFRLTLYSQNCIAVAAAGKLRSITSDYWLIVD
jgi:hypothetical protein